MADRSPLTPTWAPAPRASWLVYLAGPVAIGAFWELQRHGLIANSPIWLVITLIAASGPVNLAAERWFCAKPDSAVRVQARVAASALTTMVILYAIGWGPALVIGFAVGSAEILSRMGPLGWRSALLWNAVAVAIGQLAIQLGIAPTLVSVRLSHALAVMGVTCLAIVSRVLGLTAEQVADAEAEVRERSEHFEALILHAIDVIGVVGGDGVIRSMSPAIGPMLGWEPAEIAGLPLATMLHPSEITRTERLISNLRTNPGHTHTTELQLRHRDGTDRLTVATLTNPSGKYLDNIVVNLHDVTTQRELEHQLRFAAMHDPLTGLYNRAAFTEWTTKACARAERSGNTVALLYIDLDGFKHVNDTFGHELGDRVLVEAAERLQGALRTGEVLGRLGGDEFAVLVEAISDPGTPGAIADRVLARLTEPWESLPDSSALSASIGIAFHSVAEVDATVLLRRADAAMYSAKRNGRARWEVNPADATAATPAER